ncbi:MAG TPA: hypothetical protein VKR99_02025, partial [Candidatus Eremiobacteraceae bacterium]|nr:hypothetical protein [Candidatus Eremiobacteraceae bacterium]
MKHPHDAPPVKMTTPPFRLPAVVPSSSLPEMLWLAQTDVITVPLQTFGDRPLVQVVLNGHPASFLLDTTVQQTSVDAASLADPDRSQAAQSLQIGALRFLRVPAIRNGVRAYSETYLGTETDGVIGADLLGRFPVALDYRAGTFSVFRTSAAAAAARPAQSMLVALTQTAGVPVLAVTLGGQRMGPFGIDTGSGMDFEVRSSLVSAKHLSMSGQLPELREARVSGVMHGATARASGATIGLLQIAGPLVAMPDERQRWLPAGVDGMLGGRLLERMKLFIDVPGQNIVIAPIPNASPSVYDRSG